MHSGGVAGFLAVANVTLLRVWPGRFGKTLVGHPLALPAYVVCFSIKV